MILNCLLNLLWLNANIPLRGSCAAVLKEPLYQRYIKAVCVVDGLSVSSLTNKNHTTIMTRRRFILWNGNIPIVKEPTDCTSLATVRVPKHCTSILRIF